MSTNGAAETNGREAVEAQATDDVQADPIEDNEDEERPNLPYPTVLDFPDVFVDWKNTTCDRRLSRAARSLLVEKLRQDIFAPQREQEHLILGGHDDAAQDSVWSLLERWMQQSSSLTADSASQQQLTACPLLDAAKRDQYREEEQHFLQAFPRSFPGGTSHAMKAAFPLLLTQQQSKSTSNTTTTGGSSLSSTPSSSWAQCGFCGKVFSTRFYLDHHWATSEACQQSRSQQQQLPPKEVVEDFEHSIICPAVDWCPLVGGLTACHERALRDEPYYDRGSGEDDDHHSNLVRHKWNKILHSIPCEIESIRRDCRSILATCGIPLPDDDDKSKKGGDLVDEDDWAVPDATATTTTNDPSNADHTAATCFCDTLTCPRQQSVWQYLQDETEDYYQWYLSGDGGGNFRSLNHHDEHHHYLWNREIDHHRGLWSMVGVFLLTGLAFWIYRRVAHESSSRSGPHTRGSSGLKALTKRRKSYQNPRRPSTDRVKLD